MALLTRQGNGNLRSNPSSALEDGLSQHPRLHGSTTLWSCAQQQAAWPMSALGHRSLHDLPTTPSKKEVSVLAIPEVKVQTHYLGQSPATVGPLGHQAGCPQEVQDAQFILGRGGYVHTQRQHGLPTYSCSIALLPPLAWVDTWDQSSFPVCRGCNECASLELTDQSAGLRRGRRRPWTLAAEQ